MFQYLQSKNLNAQIIAPSTDKVFQRLELRKIENDNPKIKKLNELIANWSISAYLCLEIRSFFWLQTTEQLACRIAEIRLRV